MNGFVFNKGLETFPIVTYVKYLTADCFLFAPFNFVLVLFDVFFEISLGLFVLPLCKNATHFLCNAAKK